MGRKEKDRMIESIYKLIERYDVMTNSSHKTRFIYNIYSAYWCDFNDYVNVSKCKHCELCVVDENMECVGIDTLCDTIGPLRRVLR